MSKLRDEQNRTVKERTALKVDALASDLGIERKAAHLRRQVAQARAVGLLVLLTVLALCRLGVVPVLAQAPSISAGPPPDGRLQLLNGGTPVTPTTTVGPCTILTLNWFATRNDWDQRVGGPPGDYGVDNSSTVIKYSDSGGGGSFLTETSPGVYELAELNDDGLASATHYRPGSASGSGPTTVTVTATVDDTGPGNNADVFYQGNFYPGYDDPPNQVEEVIFLVEGEPTCVSTGRISGAPHFSDCGSCNQQRGMSSVTPKGGVVSFSVPVTSWNYKGTQLDFSLTYNSRSSTDPGLAYHQVWNPACLSDRNPKAAYNPKWSHTYAQWIELPSGPSGPAVWHRGNGSQTRFAQTILSNTSVWIPEDSFHTLTSVGDNVAMPADPPITSPTHYPQGTALRVKYPFHSFTLKDGAGNTYSFNQVLWNVYPKVKVAEPGYLIPYYLLSSITDRWGRSVSIGWGSVGGPADAYGVTSVTDGDGRGLDLNYTNGLLTSVVDPYGRTHTLTYVAMPVQTIGQTQDKLASVTVYGPGSPNRVKYLWEFGYATYTPNSYGGTYTGDLVTYKKEPSGKEVYYEHAPVNLARNNISDWDGAMTRSFYADDIENPALPPVREILRPTDGQLTYPGGDNYSYTYGTGANIDNLVKIRRNATGAEINYEYDSLRNLTKMWTQAESSFAPLLSISYTLGGASGRQITYAQSTDKLGNQSEAFFNAFNLPTQATALAATGSSLSDQTTNFTYDGGGALLLGNLTRAVTAVGTASQLTTDLAYASTTAPTQPSSITEPTGAVTTATYHGSGAPATVSSPVNLLVPLADPDYPSSVSQMTLNGEELPASFTNPAGHQVNVTYNAESLGSNRLVVTLTDTADSSTTKITLDANGQVVKAVDEKNISTTWEYGRGGQLLREARAAGTALERLTLYSYDAAGRLAYFDPPSGSLGRISYDYRRYVRGFGGAISLASPVVDEGQVTRITYSDGSSEYFGYNTSGENTWSRDRNGRDTEYLYDSLHRLYQTQTPAVDIPLTAPNPDYPARTTTLSFDEFGRVTTVSDTEAGTTTYTYDDQNRVKTVSPGIGKGITYTYVRDTTNKRWWTRVQLSGIGNSWEYYSDTKGRLSQVKNPFLQVSTYRYDPAGKLQRLDRSNGAYTLFGYNARELPSYIEHRKLGGALLDRFDYGYLDSASVYDARGRLQTETDSGGRLHRFTYNNLGELTNEAHPDFTTTTNLYTVNGNRTQKSNGVGGTWYAGYDNHDRLLWVNQASNTDPSVTPPATAPYRIYTYDSAGQPTQLVHRDVASGPIYTDRYEWDGREQLRQIVRLPSTVLYTAQYDADGERVRANLGGTAHEYSFGAGLLHDTDGGTTYTPGLSQRRSGVDSYFHEDWLGSTRYTTAADGVTTPAAYRYDAFGNLSAFAGVDSTASKYAGAHGYRSDAGNGLQVLGLRHYDSVVGRFVNPDPIRHSGGLNLYGYVENDPVNGVDPTGLRLLSIEEHRQNRIREIREWAASRFRPEDSIPLTLGGPIRGGIGLISRLAARCGGIGKMLSRLPLLGKGRGGTQERFKRGRPVIPDREAGGQAAYDWALMSTEQRVERVVEKYGFNLRGSGKKITIFIDPKAPTGRYGSVREDSPTIIRLGPEALTSEERMATTIAHELRHSRAYLGSGSNSERAAKASENAMRSYIKGER